ncbi:MAG: DUF3427 domain-containing protein [Erysipelotrichaceae bacterium]|nr:DUF3427 domain-containing protein [Erysipelotrichaceae bacterium]
MTSGFYTNESELKFVDKLKKNIDNCQSFYFSVSFIKKPGVILLSANIEATLKRGAKGKLITSTYQNFTDIDSLNYFYNLSLKYPNQFSCHLDKDCFFDSNNNSLGFHTKGYLFEFGNYNELIVGSSNITLFALIKNIEWDVSVIDDDHNSTYKQAKEEYDKLWNKTLPLTRDLIDEYKLRLYYSIERWDMDYDVANSEIKPNYMQRKALKELNRIRVMGAQRALICASAGSGKTYLSAFDALNFNPERLLYIVHEGSILTKSFNSFREVFGSRKTFGIYNGEFKDSDKDFVFSTNVTMVNSLQLFDKQSFDYIIIDECHHATAETYRKIIEYFQPEFLLGITATPERMDGADVFELFDQNVPYELRLRDAIINDLVVPFHYYGIRDDLIEYGISETKSHKFVEQFSDEKHCSFIHEMIEKHRVPGKKLKALAFCKDISHAIRMSQAMDEYYNTRCLTGRNSVGERIRAYNDLQSENDKLEILFTVDILNEGVDIPGVNMVLFLRPTDSQTVFIQQLGRGLRKYEDKKYVTVLDFIGNDYKRSVQIAFALGSLSDNFVLEKRLVSNLIQDDFQSIGLNDYGVEIHIDDLSKKEILAYIDKVNFNTQQYLETDYYNFKKYIGSESYPAHVDYLNNDFAPDLIRFLQSKINTKKNRSYYGFLKAIHENDLPSFSERQVQFINYVSDMLPIVRPYEYLIIQRLILSAGKEQVNILRNYVKTNTIYYLDEAFDHAIQYMIEFGFFVRDDDSILLNDISLNVEFDLYMKDLLEYGLGKFDIDFFDLKDGEPFLIWGQYRKEQIQQLLLKNPRDIMKGTKIYGRTAYAFVNVIKEEQTIDNLRYSDGYIDNKTFQWETEANIKDKDLNALKNSERMHIFVRKVEKENGITLPLTYIGSGKMCFVPNSKKENGAYLFHVKMEIEASEDIYFDFKLPDY